MGRGDPDLAAGPSRLVDLGAVKLCTNGCLADSNRFQPGAGHTDFAPIFEALREIGFDGYMAMECGIRGDARTVLPQIVSRLRSIMGERGGTR